MGAVCDQEVVSLVGGGENVAHLLAPSIQEATSAGVHTQLQALEWLGGKVRLPRNAGTPQAGAAANNGRNRRSRADEARDVLAGVVLAHVPVERYDFKCAPLTVCLRQHPLTRMFP